MNCPERKENNSLDASLLSSTRLKGRRRLHIDTDPLGIYLNQEPPPTPAGNLPAVPHLAHVPLVPPPLSPSSSTSSTVVSPLACSAPAAIHIPPNSASSPIITRKRSILRRNSTATSQQQAISSQSWEHIRSPAASFLASFALSPTVIGNYEEEAEGDEIDDYVLNRVVGSGGFSTVREGYRISDGTRVAVKVIRRYLNDTEQTAQYERELSIWKSLGDHPNVLRIHQILETDTAIYVVCDYCPGGNLLKLAQRRLTEDEARPLFREICTGVQFLHNQCKVVHKDLKLENVLLDQDGHIKICDFGLAVYQQTSGSSSDKTSYPNSCETNKMDDTIAAGGSLACVAPEQILSEKALCCPKTDVWSLGVMLYALVNGQLPFVDDYVPRLQQSIIHGRFEIPKGLTPELQALLRCCLHINPELRYSIDQVAAHPWLSFPSRSF